MWPFSLFRRKVTPPTAEDSPDFSFLGEDHKDYLGKAAALEAQAHEAVREKRFDDAWRLLHEQKGEYSMHARQYGMTKQQTIALNGSVHEALANIRRLEGNHTYALVHLLYCVLNSPRPTQTELKKLKPYLKRAGTDSRYHNYGVAELKRSIGADLGLRQLQLTVARWSQTSK